MYHGLKHCFHTASVVELLIVTARADTATVLVVELLDSWGAASEGHVQDVLRKVGNTTHPDLKLFDLGMFAKTADGWQDVAFFKEYAFHV